MRDAAQYDTLQFVEPLETEERCRAGPGVRMVVVCGGWGWGVGVPRSPTAGFGGGASMQWQGLGSVRGSFMPADFLLPTIHPTFCAG